MPAASGRERVLKSIEFVGDSVPVPVWTVVAAAEKTDTPTLNWIHAVAASAATGPIELGHGAGVPGELAAAVAHRLSSLCSRHVRLSTTASARHPQARPRLAVEARRPPRRTADVP